MSDERWLLYALNKGTDEESDTVLRGVERIDVLAHVGRLMNLHDTILVEREPEARDENDARADRDAARPDPRHVG